MIAIEIRNQCTIRPFGVPARRLRIVGRPLWQHHRDVLLHFGITECLQAASLADLQRIPFQEAVVYRDDLFFNLDLVSAFLKEARAGGKPSQMGFSAEDPWMSEHAVWLQSVIERKRDAYSVPFYYLPQGYSERVQLRLMSSSAQEAWYLALPTTDHYLRKGLYLDAEMPDRLKFSPCRLFVPRRYLLVIESWVHLLLANVLLGIYSEATSLDETVGNPWFRKRLALRSFLERTSPISCSEMVRIGQDCRIDPTATLLGPTSVGDGSIIGPGATVVASVVGQNVTLGQGSQVRLSVLEDGCTFPHEGGAIWSHIMERAIINSTVGFSVIGSGSFVGRGVHVTDRVLAGNSITDENLGGEMVRTWHRGRLEYTGLFFLGCAVAPNVKIASGQIVYPGRIVEHDLVRLSRAVEDTSSMTT